jgi:hypothetical protein
MIALPMGQKFNATYCTDVILLRVLHFGLKARDRQLIIHTHNAGLHTAQMAQGLSEENQLQPAYHPPYLSDLQTCDFYLFGHIKIPLKGCQFLSEEASVQAIQKNPRRNNSRHFGTNFRRMGGEAEMDH